MLYGAAVIVVGCRVAGSHCGHSDPGILLPPGRSAERSLRSVWCYADRASWERVELDRVLQVAYVQSCTSQGLFWTLLTDRERKGIAADRCGVNL
ncbi:hypothetical protein RRG08_043058 [Elysia crispata]|uniref:Uncharacterized protein n=1 Tax=Elysia crispata TaxID=231223 RepID=A0AAE0XXY8_9GAST|nr:hypothetical protein RRG08_043058 [Elysia crispata]